MGSSMLVLDRAVEMGPSMPKKNPIQPEVCRIKKALTLQAEMPTQATSKNKLPSNTKPLFKNGGIYIIQNNLKKNHGKNSLVFIPVTLTAWINDKRGGARLPCRWGMERRGSRVSPREEWRVNAGLPWGRRREDRKRYGAQQKKFHGNKSIRNVF